MRVSPSHPTTVLVAFIGHLCCASSANAAPVVRVDVRWNGACENRAMLETELSRRGVELAQTSQKDDPTDGLRLVVTAADQADPSAPTGVVATLELSDRVGGREVRTVEVRHCDELQPAVAVILAVFAQNARVLPLDSGAQVLPPAAEQVGANVTVPPSRYVSRTGQSSSSGLKRAPPSASSERELLLGLAFVGGVGWVKSPAIGPLVHLDWRPSGSLPLAFRI